jgi:hypothetical protein
LLMVGWLSQLFWHSVGLQTTVMIPLTQSETKERSYLLIISFCVTTGPAFLDRSAGGHSVALLQATRCYSIWHTGSHSLLIRHSDR